MAKNKAADISLLEKELNITEHNYNAELNNAGELIAIDLFDSEYEELRIETDLPAVLSKFRKLESIGIDGDILIKNLDSLAALTHLKRLSIESGEGISSLTPLAALTELEEISLYGSRVSDLEPLRGLKKLQVLRLPSSLCDNLHVFTEHHLLEYLDVSENKLSSLAGLENCKNLKTLYAGKNQLSEISVLSHLPQLENLNISFNRISDLHPLRKLIHLNGLHFSDNEVTHIAALGECRDLKYVNLSNNLVEDIDVLASQVTLLNLWLSANPVKDLSAIKKLKSLELLHADRILFDTSVLEELSNLKELSLVECGLSDISFCRKLGKLQHLNLSKNNISDVSALSVNHELRFLHLESNKIDRPLPSNLVDNLTVLDLRENEYGAQCFSRYGYYVESGQVANFNDLDAANARFHYQQGHYDEALALHFFQANGIEKLRIYTAKLEACDRYDRFRLRYYFVKAKEAYNHKDLNKDDPEVIGLVDRINHVILKSSLPYKEELLQSWKNVWYKFSLLKDYHEMHMTPDSVPPEVLYELGHNFRRRSDLMKMLFFYKELVRLNSPFQYTLLRSIREVLRAQFAWTEQERKEYKEFEELVNNIRSAHIPEFNVNQYYDQNYSSNYVKGPDWRLILLIVIVIFLIMKLIVTGLF